MSTLASAAAVLFAATSQFAGEIVAYQRGTSTLFYSMVSLGRSTLVTDSGDGGTIEVLSHDFIIQASDLADNGNVIPLKGDRIVRTVPNGSFSQTLTYEMMTPPYSPMDVAGTLLRLHTLLISTR